MVSMAHNPYGIGPVPVCPALAATNGATPSAHFSRRVLVTASSNRRFAVGHSAVEMASSAYICSFFFRICSYTAPLAWCLALLHKEPGTARYQRIETANFDNRCVRRVLHALGDVCQDEVEALGGIQISLQVTNSKRHKSAQLAKCLRHILARIQCTQQQGLARAALQAGRGTRHLHHGVRHPAVVEERDVAHRDLGGEQALAQEGVQRRHRLQ